MKPHSIQRSSEEKAALLSYHKGNRVYTLKVLYLNGFVGPNPFEGEVREVDSDKEAECKFYLNVTDEEAIEYLDELLEKQ